jgi:hypothetical protein
MIAQATTPRVLDNGPTCIGRTITLTGLYPHNHNNNLRT